MSTDLLLVSLEIGLDTEPDWTKAKATLAAFTPEALTALLERCSVYEAVEDEALGEREPLTPPPTTAETLRSRLGRGLDVLQAFWEGDPSATIHTLSKSRVLLFGGDSCGDLPCDGWLDACLAIDAGLATAAGFLTNDSNAMYLGIPETPPKGATDNG